MPQGHYTDQGSKGRGQYDVQGAHCSLSTASEVFHIFTTQINAQLFHLKCTIVKDLSRRKYSYMHMTTSSHTSCSTVPHFRQVIIIILRTLYY